jgi:Fe-S oxidoreductase
MDKSDYQFVDMGIVDSCCGSGGTFGFTQPEISLAIGSKLMARIQDTNAGIVATSCPGCMLQIEGLAKRRGASLQVRHIATIAAQIIKNT